MDKIRIRELLLEDSIIIAKAFKDQGWNKPQDQYNDYYKESLEGKRVILIAEYEGEFAGYITLLWESDDPCFSEADIPEIKDFNVLIKFRRKGIGNALMDEIERIGFESSSQIGLSVGLLKDYGSAQRIYVKRGYIPVGDGIKYGNRVLAYFDKVDVDDDLVLSFIKELDSE